MKQKIIFTTVGLLIGLILGGGGGYYVGYQEDKTAQMHRQEQPKSVTLEGKVVCLLPKNEDGPHTLECAVGLQTDDNKYYGISTDTSDTSLSSAAGSDKKVKISGMLTSSIDNKYKSEGTVKVESSEFIE